MTPPPVGHINWVHRCSAFVFEDAETVFFWSKINSYTYLGVLMLHVSSRCCIIGFFSIISVIISMISIVSVIIIIIGIINADFCLPNCWTCLAGGTCGAHVLRHIYYAICGMFGGFSGIFRHIFSHSHKFWPHILGPFWVIWFLFAISFTFGNFQLFLATVDHFWVIWAVLAIFGVVS